MSAMLILEAAFSTEHCILNAQWRFWLLLRLAKDSIKSWDGLPHICSTLPNMSTNRLHCCACDTYKSFTPTSNFAKSHSQSTSDWMGPKSSSHRSAHSWHSGSSYEVQ